MRNPLPAFLVGLCILGAACSRRKPDPPRNAMSRDVHSYSEPEKIRVTHLDLDCDVLFGSKTLRGSATLTIERSAGAGDAPLIVDTRDLAIEKVELSTDGATFTPGSFELGAADKILGSPLRIPVSAATRKVRIHYSTSPAASGLQWLEPAQTAGRKHPFLFSQSQAIHARSWIPLQDTPAVRFTYEARIRTPKTLRALMSADNDPNAPRTGEYRFRMTLPIPSYLMALAVGDMEFRAISPRSGVYAEPPVIEAAAKEFEDTEKMIEAVESLYGPYRWGRYDILVLPPSFPFGGMENPKLTFATPTILAGDKSLVSLVSHELAHSWSGNLVTNATWSDFWLNEGVTTYIEMRIQERIYGRARAEMEAVLGKQTLEKELKELPPGDQVLHIDLAGRDPDDGVTDVPYIKGMLFLRTLEENFGRPRFDAFLRAYFDHFAFQSITTSQFLDYLRRNLLDQNPAVSARIPIDEWVYKPGLPAGAAEPRSDAFEKVRQQAEAWYLGKLDLNAISSAGWTTQEWLHFLRYFEQHPLEPARMQALDNRFHFTRSGNAEIVAEWLLLAVRRQYHAADARLEAFLVGVGRRKFLKPLYQELLQTPEGAARARAIFAKARPGYHPITAASVAGWLEKGPAK